jgi:hypothetical protein
MSPALLERYGQPEPVLASPPYGSQLPGLLVSEITGPSLYRRLPTLSGSGTYGRTGVMIVPCLIVRGGLRMDVVPGIDPSVPPSGPGCAECEAAGGWWFHLRRCAQCGHIGCCDTSPSQHATAHAVSIGHPIIQSFEPGEDWFWDYRTSSLVDGPELAPPAHHPLDQAVPGPAPRVPVDWQDHLH